MCLQGQAGDAQKQHPGETLNPMVGNAPEMVWFFGKPHGDLGALNSGKWLVSGPVSLVALHFYFYLHKIFLPCLSSARQMLKRQLTILDFKQIVPGSKPPVMRLSRYA